MAEATSTRLCWQLSERMRDAGISSVAELHRRLEQDRVLISEVQLGRIVREMPVRLNMGVFSALCRVLACSPGDILNVGERKDTTNQVAPATTKRSRRPQLSAKEIRRLVGPAFKLHKARHSP